jgi:hypothetical protein
MKILVEFIPIKVVACDACHTNLSDKHHYAFALFVADELVSLLQSVLVLLPTCPFSPSPEITAWKLYNTR